MTNLVFPNSIFGLRYPRSRMPIWKTKVEEAVSGKESAFRYMQYPRWEYTLSYELLRDDVSVSELGLLVGLFNACCGRFDTFLYEDPWFKSVTDESFGTGDGNTVAYPITATYRAAGGPGAAELIQNFSSTPVIKVNAIVLSTPSQYTLGPTGVVTFVTPPAVGHSITWTGNFYYRCRFLTDTLNFEEFMQRWWQLGTMRFRTVKL